MSRALRSIFVSGVCVVFVACTNDSSSSTGSSSTGNPSGGNNTAPSSIDLSPSGSVTLDALQATQSVSATVKNSAGAVVSANVTWSSDAPAIATIPSSGGTVTAVANGTAHITATTGTVTSTPLTVIVQQKASQLTRVSGDAQQGTVNTALSSPLVVLAGDRNSNAVASTTVNFSTTTGTLGSASATTGADGRASMTWTLPKASGAASVTAALASDATKAVSFSATANPGPATTLVKIDGDGQRATVSTQLPTQIVAAAVDQFNNAVPNVPVLFAVTAGGGFLNSAGGSTGPNGQTVVTWTLGADSIAPQTAQAASGGLGGSPVVFTAIGIRASLNTLGPSPFKSGCHLTTTTSGITSADLPKITVTFDGVAATSVTLTGQSGRSATLTAVAPSLTKANGAGVVVVIKIYSQTIVQNLVFDAGASCS